MKEDGWVEIVGGWGEGEGEGRRGGEGLCMIGARGQGSGFDWDLMGGYGVFWWGFGSILNGFWDYWD